MEATPPSHSPLQLTKPIHLGLNSVKSFSINRGGSEKKRMTQSQKLTSLTSDNIIAVRDGDDTIVNIENLRRREAEYSPSVQRPRLPHLQEGTLFYGKGLSILKDIKQKRFVEKKKERQANQTSIEVTPRPKPFKGSLASQTLPPSHFPEKNSLGRKQNDLIDSEASNKKADLRLTQAFQSNVFSLSHSLYEENDDFNHDYLDNETKRDGKKEDILLIKEDSYIEESSKLGPVAHAAVDGLNYHEARLIYIEAKKNYDNKLKLLISESRSRYNLKDFYTQINSEDPRIKPAYDAYVAARSAYKRIKDIAFDNVSQTEIELYEKIKEAFREASEFGENIDNQRENLVDAFRTVAGVLGALVKYAPIITIPAEIYFLWQDVKDIIGLAKVRSAASKKAKEFKENEALSKDEELNVITENIKYNMMQLLQEQAASAGRSAMVIIAGAMNLYYTFVDGEVATEDESIFAEPKGPLGIAAYTLSGAIAVVGLGIGIYRYYSVKKLENTRSEIQNARADASIENNSLENTSDAYDDKRQEIIKKLFVEKTFEEQNAILLNHGIIPQTIDSQKVRFFEQEDDGSWQFKLNSEHLDLVKKAFRNQSLAVQNAVLSHYCSTTQSERNAYESENTDGFNSVILAIASQYKIGFDKLMRDRLRMPVSEPLNFKSKAYQDEILKFINLPIDEQNGILVRYDIIIQTDDSEALSFFEKEKDEESGDSQWIFKFNSDDSEFAAKAFRAQSLDFQNAILSNYGVPSQTSRGDYEKANPEGFMEITKWIGKEYFNKFEAFMRDKILYEVTMDLTRIDPSAALLALCIRFKLEDSMYEQYKKELTSKANQERAAAAREEREPNMRVLLAPEKPDFPRPVLSLLEDLGVDDTNLDRLRHGTAKTLYDAVALVADDLYMVP